MSAPQVVLDLVDRFHQQIDAYKSGSYNETQLRREFTDPLFAIITGSTRPTGRLTTWCMNSTA